MAFARASVIIRFFFFRKPGEWLTVEANNIIYAVWLYECSKIALIINWKVIVLTLYREYV